MPYLYIDKVFNELKDELNTAMHQAIKSELRDGRVDVGRLLRTFTRAAAKQMPNPVYVPDKCVEEHGLRSKKGAKTKTDD